METLRMSLSLTLLILMALPSQNPYQADPVTLIAPLLGDEITAVIHLDLDLLDFVDTVKRMSGKLADDKNFVREIEAAGKMIDSIKEAGAQDLFLMVDPTDLRNLTWFVLNLKPGSDPRSIQAQVRKLLTQYVTEPVSVEVIGSLMVVGPPSTIRLARAVKNPPRAELATAFAASDDSPARILIIPGIVQRKALEETITNLPPELGGGPITTFTQGLTWGTMFLAPGEEPGLKLLLQGKDAATAGKFANMATNAKALAIERLKESPLLAQSAGMLDKLNPQNKGDRLVIEVSPGLLSDLIIPFIQSARESRLRNICVRNLKRIGLAMHNYHQAHKAFPRQANVDHTGKPLLSWRVQILPFLGQQELYNQFHLDEPWDSEHNKDLISKMPAVFACPSGNHEAGQGKTCYVVPHGERTILSGKQGGKLQDILDGTSRTIMVAEVGDDISVIWTRPDDWQIGETVDLKPLLGHHPGGTNILFADGSVRFVKETIPQALLKALLTRDGGELISPDAF